MESMWLEGHLPQRVQGEHSKCGMTTSSVKDCTAGCRRSIALRELGWRDIETALVQSVTTIIEGLFVLSQEQGATHKSNFLLSVTKDNIE